MKYAKPLCCLKHFFFLSSILLLSSCANFSHSQDESLAEIDGKPITEKELISQMDPKVQKQYHLFKKQQLDRMVATLLFEKEAARRKLTVNELLQQEVFSKIKVSSEEIKKYSDQHKQEFKNKKEKEKIVHITEHIKNDKMKSLTKQFLTQLAQRENVKYFLSSQL